MESFCTCGATLVDGARFCHKCGRPLFESPVVEPEPVVHPVSEATPPAAHPIPEISFRNAVAVRVGFVVAGMGMFLSNLAAVFPSMPLQLFAFLGLSGASGAFAVWLYTRRTGQTLSIKSGARLGWITGVFSFVITTVLTTVTIAIVGLDRMGDLYRSSMASANLPSGELDRFFANPAAVAAALIFSLAVFFATYTIAASLGGAFGAKLLDKGGNPV